MSDLISREAVIDVLKQTGIIQDNDLGHCVIDEINRIPIAYDVDKVVKQLEVAKNGYSTAQYMTATNDELIKRFSAKEKAMNLAIEIVKAGGSN